MEETRRHGEVQVQEADFDPGAELEALRTPEDGALVSFTGVARGRNDGFAVESMTLEHYPGMTERALQDIVEEARRRWPLGRVRVIHRFGTLRPGDRIVWVGVASPHRDAAFDACRFLIDYLKTEAPFWKRETGSEGSRWVDAKESDDRAKEKWRG